MTSGRSLTLGLASAGVLLAAVHETVPSLTVRLIVRAPVFGVSEPLV